MITLLFYACVWLLMLAATALGTTYEAVNVVFFCVVWPLFTIAETIAIVLLVRRVRRYRARIRELEGVPISIGASGRTRASTWAWRSAGALAAGLMVAVSATAYAEFGRVGNARLESCTTRVRAQALKGAYRGPSKYDEFTGSYRALRRCVAERPDA